VTQNALLLTHSEKVPPPPAPAMAKERRIGGDAERRNLDVKLGSGSKMQDSRCKITFEQT
jgi:hypothetical protein